MERVVAFSIEVQSDLSRYASSYMHVWVADVVGDSFHAWKTWNFVLCRLPCEELFP
jgi:hypothetical protein